MKIVFNGTLDKSTKRCPVCGGGKTSGGPVFVRTKAYYLPSGGMKTFRAGVPEEVADEDGRFLLSYQYEDANGDVRKIFEECQ